MTSRYPGGLIRKNAANTAITGASGVWDLGSQAQAVRNNTWPISGLANPVSGSLRFRASAGAWLNRTPANASNRRTFTLSAWIKRQKLGAPQPILVGFNGGSQYTSIGFNSSDQFYIPQDNGSGGIFYPTTNAVFRDPSAWYHVVVAFDTPQATASDRLKVYVNSVQQTLTGAAIYPPQNTDTWINIANSQFIGGWSTISEYTDGYLAEVNFIDGQALTPSYFGQTSAITGVWEPIKYTGTYGTNGFYLSLSDTSSIGKDFSGNVNNWTPNNISTASGSTFDLMRDVPTQYTPQGATDVGGVVRGNYATLNPLMFRLSNTPGATLSAGNLTSTHTPSAYGSYVFSSIAATGDKFYYEAVVTTLIGGVSIGIDGGLGVNSSEAARVVYQNSGLKRVNGSSSAYGASYTTNDVIGVALDLINGTITFYKNNVSQGVASSGIGTTPYFTYGESDTGNVINWNFGQRPFAYTPPSGFKSLCTTNLPTPTIGATAAELANEYFDASLYTGNGTSVSVTNSGSMQPDFVWVKSRSNALNNCLIDSVRGVSKSLFTDVTDAELFFAGYYVTSFNSNGFTAGLGTGVNQNAATYVGWQWRASNTTPVSNTQGSITSTVSASTIAGFSIVTFTAPSSGQFTVGHGLGVTPNMVIVKNRTTGSTTWFVYHSSLGVNNTDYLVLNSTAAEASFSTMWGSAGMTSSTCGFTVGGSTYANDNHVAYCFAQVAGYSAFGSYTGNGSTDGPFVYLGFRPKFVMTKKSSGTENWAIIDSSRSSYNLQGADLYADLANAETTSGYDLLSNGIKFRSSGGSWNASGATYIYMAFAEHPFKNSLAR